VTTFRISEAAALLGVSADTVRRWIDSGRLPADRDAHGHRLVAGADLAAFARSQIDAESGSGHSSARNRFRGIVTEVVKDAVMAQVEIAAGAQGWWPSP
jgi:excisionase family DNA binding protein